MPSPVHDPLHDLPLLATFTAEERSALLAAMTARTYRRGQALVREGEPADSLLLLWSGLTRIYRSSPTGHDRICAVIRAPQWLGENGLLGYRLRVATVEAMELCHVRVLSHRGFEAFASQHPKGAIKLMRMVASRAMAMLLEVTNMNEALLSQRSRDRVITALLNLASQHGSSTEAGVQINLRLSHQDMGQLAGVSRETACRVLKEIESDGLVNRQRQYLVIPSVSKLEQCYGDTFEP